jgi:hypothetical protein
VEAATALYTEDPSAEEAAMLGLTAEEASGPPVDLWPDNVQSVDVFMALVTQWHMGPVGPTGLNYASLPEVWRRMKVPNDRRDEVFQDLRVMEMAALKKMRKH